MCLMNYVYDMELEDECKLMYEREKLLHARETTQASG